MSMDLSRRGLLKGGLTLGCSAAAFPLMSKVTFASAPGDNRLVVIVLRGALDGLAAVGPYTDRNYLSMRPNLATTPDRKGFDLDGRFALHEELGALMPLWQAGELSFVHAVSTPYRDKRSHFDGQDALESGTEAESGGMTPSKDGWLNRALSLLPGAQSSTAVAVGRDNMLLLDGANPALNWSPDSDIQLSPQALQLFRMISERDPLFAAAAREATEIDAALGMDGSAAKKVDAKSLAALSAEMLRGESRIAAFSLGGWDTHRRQEGAIRKPMNQLAEAILELKTGLGPVWEKTAVMCITEFGRTARENGSEGTDHGTGGLMIYAGGSLSKAAVFGQWPGLRSSDLFEDRDLMPTDDLRRHAAWTLRTLFGMDRARLERDVFPGIAMGQDARIFA
ncbi:MAG: DUF1501 domain-containing protein [Albimonas sp.]|uniref:DUF1501 domain-containing protein n=1 Tax=Albimonas sp. TaxID=1872425 RepID=UPI004056747C